MIQGKSRTATVLSSLLGPAVNNNTPLQQRQNLLDTPSRDQKQYVQDVIIITSKNKLPSFSIFNLK